VYVSNNDWRLLKHSEGCDVYRLPAYGSRFYGCKSY
jgi:hypothetical protein